MIAMIRILMLTGLTVLNARRWQILSRFRSNVLPKSVFFLPFGILSIQLFYGQIVMDVAMALILHSPLMSEVGGLLLVGYFAGRTSLGVLS